MNHNYTVTLSDALGRTMVFRDMRGTDLEFLESLLGTESTTLSSDDVVAILDRLRVSPPNARMQSLTPRTIRAVYGAVSKHILHNYMPKETWLRQCYSIQNGSFQNVAAMERVPMSKFTAMCMIHKEAMDQIGNENASIENKI